MSLSLSLKKHIFLASFNHAENLKYLDKLLIFFLNK